MTRAKQTGLIPAMYGHTHTHLEQMTKMCLSNYSRIQEPKGSYYCELCRVQKLTLGRERFQTLDRTTGDE